MSIVKKWWKLCCLPKKCLAMQCFQKMIFTVRHTWKVDTKCCLTMFIYWCCGRFSASGNLLPAHQTYLTVRWYRCCCFWQGKPKTPFFNIWPSTQFKGTWRPDQTYCTVESVTMGLAMISIMLRCLMLNCWSSILQNSKRHSLKNIRMGSLLW